MQPDQTSILLIDSNASDCALAARLLRDDLPNAEITVVSDLSALHAALDEIHASVAVLAPEADWNSAPEILSLLGRESPHTAVVLFGRESEIIDSSLNPGLAFAGMVRKSSAGFMALGSIVRDALARRPLVDPLGLEDLPYAAFFASSTGQLSFGNSAFARHAEMSEARLLATTVHALCANEQAALAWSTFCAGDDIDLDLQLRLPSGETRRACIRRDLRRTPQRRFLGTLLTSAAPDISVVAPPSNLQNNREMHDIALVFSHDLKEPVQQIVRLVQRLENGSGADGPGAQVKFSRQLQTCAERASAMLDSMLEYLAVSARDEQPGLIDLNDCFEQALDNLRAAIDDCGAEIVADPLPSVAGDAYQLQHLIQNLIGNGIKFRGHVKPLIRITTSGTDRLWRIMFRDNGIGIAEQFRERVFDMGKRLHTREEYPGGGIGLTLCRRIAERHGGSIYIEAAEDGGSIVVVELPRPPGRTALRA